MTDKKEVPDFHPQEGPNAEKKNSYFTGVFLWEQGKDYRDYEDT